MLSTAWLQQQSVDIINAQHQVWIAYSGGVDSHVLLHLAQQTFVNVRAIHINDHLSANSDLCQQHCLQVCADLNVPLECRTVNITTNSNIENVARNARRTVWQNMLGTNDILFLAHHADDQAETILYRLLRGTGPRGVVGMQALSTLGAASLWRPLLNISKQEILDYARAHNLAWLEDETNLNINFDRNFLRQQVLPLLQQRWPQVKNNLRRTATLSAQLLSAAQPTIQQELANVKDGAELNLLPWQQLSLALRIETLRAWLLEHNIVLSLQRLQTIMREVIAARADAQPEYKISKGIVIRRNKNKLYLVVTQNLAIEFTQDWDLKNNLQLPNGMQLQPEMFDKYSNQLLTVKLGQHGRKAKKIFQQFGVPPWVRNQYPLVFMGARLVSVVGLWQTPRV